MSTQPERKKPHEPTVTSSHFTPPSIPATSVAISGARPPFASPTFKETAAHREEVRQFVTSWSLLGEQISNRSSQLLGSHVPSFDNSTCITTSSKGLQEKEVAANEAEVQALESSVEGQSRGASVVNLPAADPKTRTAAYIHGTPDNTDVHLNPLAREFTEQDRGDDHKIRLHVFPEKSRGDVYSSPEVRTEARHYLPETDNYNRQDYSRRQDPVQVNSLTHRANCDPLPNTRQLTQYLMRKDLTISRLYVFDGTPESYRTWKATVKSVMEELDVNNSEELDLLLKWSGPSCKQQILSIKSASAGNPSLGLLRAWERLEERFGSAEMVESSIKLRVKSFPKILPNNVKVLYDFADLVSEIEALMLEPKLETLLAYYNSSSGVTPLVCKLPYFLQDKWTSSAIGFTKKHHVVYPPFTHFAAFIREQSNLRNNPSFWYSRVDETLSNRNPQKVQNTANPQRVQNNVTVRKLDTQVTTVCPIHNTQHPLSECMVFRFKSMSERKRILLENNLCFRCCKTDKHTRRMCKEQVKCNICSSDFHPSAMHPNRSPSQHGGEGEGSNRPAVSNKCTKVCNGRFEGRSCSKTVLARVYPTGKPHLGQLMYVILDDQSNRTLGRPEFFDLMHVPNGTTQPYTLVSCAGGINTQGRCARGLTISSVDERFSVEVPSILECDQVPNERAEIPTPEVISHHRHLNCVPIPALDPRCEILLLIGRDVPEVHHVHDQVIGPVGSPFAQRLNLGWVVVGNVCLGRTHKPDVVGVRKTNVLGDGRPTVFEPCVSTFMVKDRPAVMGLGSDVFWKTQFDDKPALSQEDRAFLAIMDGHFHKGSDGRWTSPLPFRNPRPHLPNNRCQALRRARALDINLRKNPIKREHLVTFMEGIIDSRHAEVAPVLHSEEECWYLPFFGIYHPKKPDKIRGVFDSSATHEGTSLNKVLLKGPDLTNSLLGVLLRFRRESVAVMVDVEQMFYCFSVSESDRNFLRFFWYENNDPNKALIEYRMNKHVFGNSPSPAVASYGLRRTVAECESEFGSDVKQFVEKDFYVDDGLTSVATPAEAVSLLQRTQKALATAGIRLHKISSNSREVLDAFPPGDIARDLKNLELGSDDVPMQRSLGMCWDLQTDSFMFEVSRHFKPYTRRGVLSTINRLFDPLGLLSPVTIRGKLMLRDMIEETKDWDEPLSERFKNSWTEWEQSLQNLASLRMVRRYPERKPETELHVYSDASEQAIAAVAFLRTVDQDGNGKVGFVFGKAKVAPRHGHTIPRLELCAAVLAVQVAETVVEELSLPQRCVTFHCDSKVVLGYIANQTRRFYIYVANRVSRILKFSTPDQWLYVCSEMNPADIGTRGIAPSLLAQSVWIQGPSEIQPRDSDQKVHSLVNPDGDDELRREVHVEKLSARSTNGLGTERFSRFSVWWKLVTAMSLLRYIAGRNRKENSSGTERPESQKHKTPGSFKETEGFIIREVQREYFSREIDHLKEKKPLLRASSIWSLSPFLDEKGILRVGGRLRRGELDASEKQPILIPGRHHIATLLTRHYHERVQHQGRHFTEGAIRSAGYWITGGKRLVSSVIYRCVKCRRLRGTLCHQKMADLPVDRITPTPPFTCVGVDVFGPWDIVTRRTRGGAAASKRWAVMFTCLVMRAIHVEVIESMSSSSFINAMRRFTALRGPVQEYRSDRGTNFVGATSELGINVAEGNVKDFLDKSGSFWVFNPPHASHFGGAWERMIGVTRRILDSMLLGPHKDLTHEVLSTFLAEASAIVNARPLVPVSTDTEYPHLLSPSVMLTQKTGSQAETFQHLDEKDMFQSQWKHVQVLAERFWNQWRQEYLASLQSRRKWQTETPNVSVGDVVLLKDNDAARNDWPTGVIVCASASDDGLVRKVRVRSFTIISDRATLVSWNKDD
ncbi:PREDICTED: uncharacterized protein LOC106816503 [Priapulus caudatus]|uniref:Uncharacterized protein LOC106816503 n=1 Tax=Priapulus caudatus TaxID=37621 RepID=A0ABM1EWP5_PRICU|nr:PREDICTED: uncharacterized protein LOC106816503 [Priapulus caudatus]